MKKEIDLSVLKGKKVLLCEDHPINRKIAEMLLMKKNIDVVSAENGQMGFDIYMDNDAGTFDVILMDIRMPVMDGLETTKKIRASGKTDAKKIPIIAMTANAFDDDVQTCVDAGMNHHIAKPVEPQTMYEVIAQFVD